MLSAFTHERQSRVYVTEPFIGQGQDDLYRLASFRHQFSDNGIGQIAYHLLTQLEKMHHNGLIYKYLSPQQIVVSEGFELLKANIKVHLTNIAII